MDDEELAVTLTKKPLSIFCGFDPKVVQEILKSSSALLDPVPKRSKIAESYGFTNQDFEAHRTYEGKHLESEGADFKYIYIAINGVVVRTSKLKELDLSSRSMKAQYSRHQLKAPEEMPGGLVTLGYLLSHCRVFDIAYEYETIGAAELITGSKHWLTSSYQTCKAQLLRLDKTFYLELTDAMKYALINNVTRVAVLRWAQRCRKQQEMLTRFASGREATHGRKETLPTLLALEYLDTVVNRIMHFNNEAGSEGSPYVNLQGNMERVAFYIGLRPTGFKNTWDKFMEKPEGAPANSQNPDEQPLIIPMAGQMQYAVNVPRLKAMLGESFFLSNVEELLSE